MLDGRTTFSSIHCDSFRRCGGISTCRALRRSVLEVGHLQSSAVLASASAFLISRSISLKSIRLRCGHALSCSRWDRQHGYRALIGIDLSIRARLRQPAQARQPRCRSAGLSRAFARAAITAVRPPPGFLPFGARSNSSASMALNSDFTVHCSTLPRRASGFIPRSTLATALRSRPSSSAK